MYIPDDGEQAEVDKDKFIAEVMELLFGSDAELSEEDKSRHFSHDEAIKELKAMNDVYTEHLIEKG